MPNYHLVRTQSGHLARCGSPGNYHLRRTTCGCFLGNVPVIVSASWSFTPDDGTATNSPYNCPAAIEGSISGQAVFNPYDYCNCYLYGTLGNPYRLRISYVDGSPSLYNITLDFTPNYGLGFNAHFYAQMSAEDFQCHEINVFVGEHYSVACNCNTSGRCTGGMHPYSGSISVSVTEVP